MALLEELRERRIDVGFLRMSGSTSDQDMDYESLFQEPLIIAASKDHPLARRRSITLADLIEERWTWPPRGTFIDSLVVDAFRAAGHHPPQATVYVEPINMRIQLAATGRFLAIVPSYILRVPSNRRLVKALPVETSYYSALDRYGQNSRKPHPKSNCSRFFRLGPGNRQTPIEKQQSLIARLGTSLPYTEIPRRRLLARSGPHAMSAHMSAFRGKADDGLFMSARP